MTGKAQVCEIAVRENFTDSSEAYVLHFNPPLRDDGQRPRQFGIGVTTDGVTDVFAMDPDRPGYCLPNDDNIGWVSLLNCLVLKGPWTLSLLLRFCGYEMVR